NARVQIFYGFKYDGAPAMFHQRRSRGGRFDDCAVGTKVSAEYGQTALPHQRVVEWSDHIAVVAGGGGCVLANRLAVDGQRVAVNQIAELADHSRQAARVIEILHQVFARWHQVDQAGNVASQPVPIVEFEIDSHSSGD